jgi:23S rRNA (adenine2503-C2)-methyltransferase
MTSFFDLTLKDLEARVEPLGLKRYRARQIYKWVYQQDTLDFDGMTNLPKDLRFSLKGLFSLALPEVTEVRPSTDGSTKFGLRAADGRLVESVLIPEKERNTLCISTQIGCKMSCRFCVTGKIGFIRDLTAGEIVGQVMAVRGRLNDARITNIVFMGMGEPLDNLEHVLKSLEILEESMGLNFSYRRVTLSSVGLLDALRQIDPRRALIAISLNATTDEQRSYLMPINRIYPLRALINYAKSFGEVPRLRVTFEYVMLKGFNDSLDDAKRLADLLRGVRCKINLIPYNESPYTEFQTSDPEAVLRFQEYLVSRHFTAIVRDSRGRDVGGGCGQLGMKYLEEGRG